MVKRGKKDFTSGLDMLIQKTTETTEEPEIIAEPITEIQPENVSVKKVKAAKEKERQITITIPDTLKRTIRKYCAAHDLKIKDLVILSVTKYMNEQT